MANEQNYYPSVVGSVGPAGTVEKGSAPERRPKVKEMTSMADVDLVQHVADYVHLVVVDEFDSYGHCSG